jgi:hypothetical protein
MTEIDDHRRATPCNTSLKTHFVQNATTNRGQQRITAHWCGFRLSRRFPGNRSSPSCPRRAPQAENAGSIPVARSRRRSRQTPQVRPKVAVSTFLPSVHQDRRRATNVQQRATPRPASSATKAEDVRKQGVFGSEPGVRFAPVIVRWRRDGNVLHGPPTGASEELAGRGRGVPRPLE